MTIFPKRAGSHTPAVFGTAGRLVLRRVDPRIVALAGGSAIPASPDGRDVGT
jgi:hypothetical protein